MTGSARRGQGWFGLRMVLVYVVKDELSGVELSAKAAWCCEPIHASSAAAHSGVLPRQQLHL